ncbi:metallophosphoesterase [Marichromatium purpuratum 984]|uniref:Metallophosphoesterase n=1 Tax=Marichromatium purpuratum 984 TaxID=765910 RepID=W0DW14_MARPU|nr:metallophosphoesterase [Marichromatium purpuratum]AHF02775.1 metallophosphoesterase [Marichromatium purpuratum 984]
MVTKRNARKTFLQQFHGLVQELEGCEDVDLSGSLRLGTEKVRIPAPTLPLQIQLGSEPGYRLHLYPELCFDACAQLQPSGDYLLLDPDEYFSDISGFLRLHHGEALTLGRRDQLQRRLLRYPKLVEERHLRLKLSPKGLALKRKSTRAPACIAPLTARSTRERMARWRRRQLGQLHGLLRGPLEPLPGAEALTLLERVNTLLATEPYRVRTADDRPGGLLALPERPRPIFVGDLHARIDNLLVVLTQGGFLDALAEGSAVLILLGDAVQPDAPGREAEMEDSVLMMELIFRLKVRFPDRVFYLRGNHDSFSDEISKAGIPQGLVWEQHLIASRGQAYRDAMHRFYELLPYVAVAPSYIACHAGPPTGYCTWQMLVEIDRHPRLAHQLTHVRLRRNNSPKGYGASDLARLRRCLGVREQTPCIVGHTPLSRDETCWLDAGGIANHHVLYGAHPDWIGVITRGRKHLLPLRYPSEPLLAAYNHFADTT